MKLAILGTGMIVKDMLTGIQDLNFESVYILGTDATREETEELKTKYNLDRSFYDYDELLQSDADTVYVALPNSLHYSFAKKGLVLLALDDFAKECEGIKNYSFAKKGLRLLLLGAFAKE